MRKLKLGIIGTGSVVREIYKHLYFHSDYSQNMDILGVCDVFEAGVKSFAEENNLPAEMCYTDYKKMIDTLDLEAVAINTPDSLHKEPAIYALEAGLDILIPKPTADTIADAHAIIEKAKELNRFVGIDFHKREDPRFKEAKARFKENAYGELQSATWYMLDKLLVADPNNEPRFFASPDFAEKNTPVSFLTVHMADAFMFVTEMKPKLIKATGYKQKLPSLSPIAVNGYDLVDTEIICENGATCHIITGWTIPNTAYANTVQSARLIGSEGYLDLALGQPGFHEVLPDGIYERNPLFRNFESDGTVSGYGISSPGRILRNITRFRDGEMSADELEDLMSPFSLGFYTTVVCEAAHKSLDEGQDIGNGVTHGAYVDVAALVKEQTK
jgi:predicted dehydrogenase